MNIKKRTTPLLTALLIALAVPALQGCFPVVAAGMGTSAMMAGDRRTSDTYINDQAIESRSSSRINEKFGETIHINVTSFNRNVLLTGEVPNPAMRIDLERIVAQVPNVRTVINEAQIAAPTGYMARTSDSFLTSKVRARFFDANLFPSHHVKVVTEAGVVHLLGIVTQREGDAAVQVAQTTSGVSRVVRVFEYISEEEAKRLDYRPEQPNKSDRIAY